MNNETNTWRKIKRLFPNLDSLTQKQIDYELNNVKQEVIEEILGLDIMRDEACQMAVVDESYKKGWHWKSLGKRYTRNQLRTEIKEKIKNLKEKL